MLARARQLEAQGRRVVHMEIGEPDFDTPEHIKKAAVEALYDNHTPLHALGGYSGAARDRSPNTPAASAIFRRRTPPENVVVGPGAKPVIWNVLSALLDPGDDFIYFDPAYPAYASCSSYLQANVHAIPLLESRNWRMDLDETGSASIRQDQSRRHQLAAQSDRRRADARRSRTIAEMAQRHDFLVIADEIYSRNFYRDSEYLSIASLDGMRERTIIVDGFSKAYAMTGWRLGYAIMPEEVAKIVTLFNNNTFSCVTGVRADGRHRRADRTRRTGAPHERDVPPTPRPSDRWFERYRRLIVHAARRRVLRVPQRDGDHAGR